MIVKKINTLKYNNKYKVIDDYSFPDFIIGRAVESGVTMLHQISNKNSDVLIAKDKFRFYDIDSIIEHTDFNFFDESSKYHIQNIDRDHCNNQQVVF